MSRGAVPARGEALPVGPGAEAWGFPAELLLGQRRHNSGSGSWRVSIWMTLLPLERIRRTARLSWEPGGFSRGSEGRLCLISRAQQCQMTPAFHYRLLTTLFITAKWFAARRLPTGLPSLAPIWYGVWIKLDKAAMVINSKPLSYEAMHKW